MTSNNLPPSRYLPHWTRVGRLGKPCCPGRLQANQPLRRPTAAVPVTDRGVGTTAADASCRSGLDARVTSLQRNIQFLQQQHKETLEKLHAEIDDLRRENKELQYKLIMKAPNTNRKGLTNSQRACKSTTQSCEAHAGLQLEEPLQDTRLLQDQELGSFAEGSKVLGSARLDHGTGMKGHLIASLHPLQIHSSPSRPPHAPTLQECELIVRQLYNANRSQSEEIVRMKTLLSDIVLSKKITPQNYILTKTFLINGNGSGPSQSRVVLPALKQSLRSNITERQSRTRAAQRDCLKRSQR